jgi:hypothetical protein
MWREKKRLTASTSAKPTMAAATGREVRVPGTIVDDPAVYQIKALCIYGFMDALRRQLAG